MSALEEKTRYDPSEVEPRITKRWIESGLTHPAPEGDASENYSIAIPPPNVTGVLHMGHALNNAIQDTLIRRARQQGKRAKWILGTDHAGIATQTQVERELASLGSSREELGREQFVGRVWAWRERYGGEIIEQIKRLGSTADFEDERFTLDPAYAEAVAKVFVDLYKKRYIYRDRYLVNWDPGSGSAISDLEVEDREVTDTLYYVDYPLASGSGSITVATVRPETMLADVAIAVNPDDERYKRLIGETAVLPIVGRKLKIIADDYVKTEFGTGALKITPGHDPNDFEIGHRHGLPHPSVIGEDGRMEGDDVPERFLGLTTAEAQVAIAAELDDLGLIQRREEYTHTVPFSQRSGSRIEPLISLQWFMRMDELAKPAIEVVKRGEIRFHPEGQGKVYLDWMENIRPWCISRQLWWGHQIPVWYRRGETYVGTTAPEGDGWVRDPDVLDTWFSSALWPFATLGWPEQTPELKAFYPTDAMVTSRDIIFLWVARMVMMGIEFTGQIPFTDVYVHSIIQAPDGRRMSKSLGTGIDPRDLIDGGPRPPVFAKDGEDPGEFPAYGADAVRWGLLAMSSGQDVRFNEEKVSQAQQLTNKLWNASRLILLRVDPDTRPHVRPTQAEDYWILSRLERARGTVAEAIDTFEFSHAALALYDFVYGELCDWYLELVKPRLYDGDPDTAATLLHVLIETVTLAHPLVPFVTEEIYGHIPGSSGLLAARVAAASAGSVDARAEADLERAIQAIQAIRTWRDAADVKPSAILPAHLSADGYGDTVAHLARLGRLELSVNGATSGADPAATTIAIPGGVVEILPSLDVDLEAAAQKRVAKRAELEQEIKRAQGKLSNAGFVAKAPPAVVDAERAKLEALQAELEAL
ncbi:MAG TPA: valine--tRNA ligase [Solirubrobacteraceae bacterium]|jgi:valyl-tRNA synthetase|nr:valine--tRNA ligase [Solirubrobacteraceae bacterium]